MAVNGLPTPLDLTLTNVGSGTINLAASDFSFIGPNAAEYSIDPVNLPAALGTGESVSIPIILTGVTPGLSPPPCASIMAVKTMMWA